MADKKKSILEEALLDANRIQEALNANSKEILTSLTKKEIDNVVKESLEEDYLEEDVDNDTEELEGDEVDVTVGDIEGSEEGDDLGGDYESGMDAVASDDGVEMDMTTASDDDVIAVYKKLTGDDEIEVVVDDEAGEVKLTVNEPGEFVIKTGEGEVDGGEELELDIEPMDADAEAEDDMELDVEPMDADADAEDDMDEPEETDDEEEEEVLYEIALDEMDAKNFADANDNTGDLGFDEDQEFANEYGEMVMSEENESLEEDEALTEEDEEEKEKDELDEQIPVGIAQEARTEGKNANIGQPRPRKVNESKVIKKYNTLLTEAKELKGKNEEYKTALKQFRTMLAETVVFNSNLTYVTKLFMEHSTSKDEKENIFKRFDNEVSTLKESKKLYKTIASELGSRKPINESIENKIIKEVSSSKSTQLNESTAYVDKETSRIMDLMKRVNNR